MGYIAYNTPNGKAYFEETSNGLSAVNDPTILKKLMSGSLAAKPQSAGETANFSKTVATPSMLPPSKNNYELPDLKTTTETGSMNTPSLTSGGPGNFTQFAAAINEAVSIAREQRQSRELDLLNGLVPAGAVSAGTFTSILGNLNKASSNYSDNLTDAAFKQIDIQNKALENDKNRLYELALTALENGASPEQVRAIKAAGTLDAGMSIAADALKDSFKDANVRQLGDKLVILEPDENGNLVPRLLYDGSPVDGNRAPKSDRVEIGNSLWEKDPETGEWKVVAGETDVNDAEQDARDDAGGMKNDNKTTDEIYQVLKIVYGNKLDDATIRGIVGMPVENTTSTKTQDTKTKSTTAPGTGFADWFGETFLGEQPNVEVRRMKELESRIGTLTVEESNELKNLWAKYPEKISSLPGEFTFS
jgi:DNA-binding protein YbaB